VLVGRKVMPHFALQRGVWSLGSHQPMEERGYWMHISEGLTSPISTTSRKHIMQCAFMFQEFWCPILIIVVIIIVITIIIITLLSSTTWCTMWSKDWKGCLASIPSSKWNLRIKSISHYKLKLFIFLCSAHHFSFVWWTVFLLHPTRMGAA